MENLENITPTGELKTLGTMLQEIVEKEDKWYSLYEFLEEATQEERRDIKNKLVDEDQKQFYEFMDWYTFVNEQEVNMACCEYFEATMNRPISMWETGDLSEVADDYMTNRNLNFEEEDEEVILPF